MRISARNQLGGTITRIEEGAVNVVVTVRLKGGDEVVSVITKDACKRLDLQVGRSATAIIKASSVMIGVE